MTLLGTPAPNSANSLCLSMAAALVMHYFGLSEEAAWTHILDLADQYPATWIRLAVIEALYQGRYKPVSVNQILAIWQRRSKPLCHFGREFESIITVPLQNLLHAPAHPGLASKLRSTPDRLPRRTLIHTLKSLWATTLDRPVPSSPVQPFNPTLAHSDRATPAPQPAQATASKPQEISKLEANPLGFPPEFPQNSLADNQGTDPADVPEPLAPVASETAPTAAVLKTTPETAPEIALETELETITQAQTESLGSEPARKLPFAPESVEFVESVALQASQSGAALSVDREPLEPSEPLESSIDAGEPPPSDRVDGPNLDLALTSTPHGDPGSAADAADRPPIAPSPATPEPVLGAAISPTPAPAPLTPEGIPTDLSPEGSFPATLALDDPPLDPPNSPHPEPDTDFDRFARSLQSPLTPPTEPSPLVAAPSLAYPPPIRRRLTTPPLPIHKFSPLQDSTGFAQKLKAFALASR